MNRFLVLVVSLVMTSNLYADPKRYYYERYLWQQAGQDSSDFATKEATFEQRLDHNDPDNADTFEQRYFVNTRYAEGADAPIILYICGESRCEPRSLDGAVKDVAVENKAVLVALEHRYYGDSQPFDEMTAENLRFLTVDQALKDIVAFQDFFAAENKLTGKWLVVGGSYPGNLSAYFRALYPDRAVGALASSAPVMAKEAFVEYDTHLAAMAGPKCLAAIRKVNDQVEREINDPDRYVELREMFDAADIIDKRDFLYVIADTAAAAVQYGMRDKFCGMIEDEEEPLENYARFAKALFASWGIRAIDMSFQSAEQTATSAHSGGIGMRQWMYQSCTEFGYFQVANADLTKSARSAQINLDFHRDTCKRLFGLEDPAHTDKTNETYFQPLLSESASRIFFTNGATDPWINLSLTSTLATQNPNIEAYEIEGAAHCDDLRRPSFLDTEALKTARRKFKEFAHEWLSAD